MQRLHDVRGQSAGGTAGTSDTHNQQSCPDTTTVRTFTAPKDAVAFAINVATTDARITLDGSTPTATNGLTIKAAQNPLYIAVGKDVKAVSTAGTAAVVDVLWLK